MEKPVIQFPWGNASSQAPAYAASIAIVVDNTKTFVKPGTLTGNLAVTCSFKSGITPIVGSELHLDVTADGTNRTVTPGSGFVGTAQTITASKRVILTFVYNGTAFLLAGSNQLN